LVALVNPTHIAGFHSGGPSSFSEVVSLWDLARSMTSGGGGGGGGGGVVILPEFAF